MKYKDFEGPIERLVNEKLEELECSMKVKVLLAVESGSRAWGFASPDSDYDVRFIYVRPMEHYLRLEPQKDFIDWELDDTLDINGWDLDKALRQIHKSNATLFEWGNSPVKYREDPLWPEIKAAAAGYFSSKAGMYHYYGTANKNYHEYLLGEKVRYKKYFYVLRPLLACQWIAVHKCPPPVLFAELMDSVLEGEMRPSVEKLLQAKKGMKESETGPRLEDINEYIAHKLAVYKEMLANMKDDRNPDWSDLNRLFLSIISR